MTAEKHDDGKGRVNKPANRIAWYTRTYFWFASWRDSPLEYLALILLEFLAILELFVMTSEAQGLMFAEVIEVLMLVFMIALLQEVLLHDVRRTHGYALYLVEKAASGNNRWVYSYRLVGFSYNLILLRKHFRALKRYADDRSSGSFEDLALGLLRVKDSCTPTDLNYSGVVHGIALGVAERASRLPPVQAHEAFGDYLQGIKRVLNASTVSISDITEFLVREYTALPLGLREQSNGSADKGILRRMERRLTKHEVLLVYSTAIISVLASLLQWMG